MRLSFLPGDLQLTKTDEGQYIITIQGEEVLRTPVEKKALTKFNSLRGEMEAQYPAREWTPEQKRSLLSKLISDSKVALSHNSLRAPKKKVVKSRTFG